MEKKNKLFKLVLTLLVGATLYSCVDNDYDLGKDVDLTMGLGADKLTLKIGDTEKMFLRDMLEIEDSEVDTLENPGRSLYYLVKGGETTVDVEVNKIPLFTVEDVNLLPVLPILPPQAEDMEIGVGKLQAENRPAEGEMNVDIENIPVEIKRLRNVYPTSNNLRMSLVIEQPSYASFVISDVKNLKITFPDFLEATYNGNPGEHVYKPANIANNSSPNPINLGTIAVNYLQFGTEAEKGQLITDGTLVVRDNVEMEGEFTLRATRAFTLRSGDEVNVKLVVELGAIDVERITGLVDPVINPTVDPIEIADDLPSFLQDPEVVLEVSNPTIKFDMRGDNLPIPLLFSGLLSSVKGSEITGPVRLPATGYDNVPASVDHLFYFYQGSEPFDPNGVNPADKAHPVPTLSTLLRKIPDYINVNLTDGKIKSDQSQLHTIKLGEDFGVELDYEVLIPFRFDRGLRIVYADSIVDMNEDLKDYQASGITVTATAVNSIPLDLKLKLVPIGFNSSGVPGQDLSDEIEVETVLIPAATGLTAAGIKETDISIVMAAGNPEAVSRLDRFEIRVDAESVASSELLSSQYFFLKDMRLKLNGQVIANFN